MNRDRKNYIAHLVEGGLFMGGLSFIAADTVLTVMAKELDAPNWLISLLPTMMFSGMILAPILSASFIERSKHMKRIAMVTGVPQRLVFLIAGLVIIFYGDSHPDYALIALALAPLFSGVFGGIGHGAWTQLVARTVPANKRSSLAANRNLLAAAVAVGAGIVIKGTLDAYDGAFGFGLLHIMAFLMLVLSYVSFIQVEEIHVEPAKLKKHRSLLAYFKDLIDILRVDVNFRNFTMMRLFGPMGSFVMPFVAIYAIDTLGAGEGFAGSAVIASTVGQVLGNLVGGYIGDRKGGRVLLISARLMFIISFILAALAQSYWSFLFYFAFSSAARYVNMIGNVTLMLEIAPDHRRPTYGALAGLLNGPTMIIFALIGSVFWSEFESMHLQAFIATAGMLISLWYILRVREPRHFKRAA